MHHSPPLTPNALQPGRGSPAADHPSAPADEHVTSTTQRIVDAITAAIVERRLMPGTKLAEPPTADIDELAREANRLNETCRIYVNLMAANVRRRLQVLAGSGAQSYRPQGSAALA